MGYINFGINNNCGIGSSMDHAAQTFLTMPMISCVRQICTRVHLSTYSLSDAYISDLTNLAWVPGIPRGVSQVCKGLVLVKTSKRAATFVREKEHLKHFTVKK